MLTLPLSALFPRDSRDATDADPNDGPSEPLFRVATAVNVELRLADVRSLPLSAGKSMRWSVSVRTGMEMVKLPPQLLVPFAHCPAAKTISSFWITPDSSSLLEVEEPSRISPSRCASPVLCSAATDALPKPGSSEPDVSPETVVSAELLEVSVSRTPDAAGKLM